ncbi:MAG: DUF5675 family protein [Gammaproteobacteria bacterium]
MQAQLIRDLRSIDCAQGKFSITDAPLPPIYTMELPWADNEPDQSCVPVGVYVLMPYYSPRHGRWTWCLHNPALGIYAYPSLVPTGVTARSCCEIHSANQAWQLEGCIAPGLARGLLDIGKGLLASVLSSDDALTAIVQVLATDGDIENATGHTLTISNQ